MEYTVLKNSDLKVSRFCMGGCPMGGYGWGETKEQDFIDSIQEALESGVNFFDTADTYGLGQSERTLAKGIGSHRHDVVIESKFGVRAGRGETLYDNSPSHIRAALEGTLKRLGTDYIDIYAIHYRDAATPIEDVVGTLEELRREGKIRYFGLSNVGEGGYAEILPYKKQFVNFQEEYSLACRKNEDRIRRMGKDFTPMSWGSLGQGILTGKYGKDAMFDVSDRRSRGAYVNFHGEKLGRNLEIVEKLREVSRLHGVSVASCAIRYILDVLPGSVVIAGVKRPSQLRANLEAMGYRLSEEEIGMLNEVSI